MTPGDLDCPSQEGLRHRVEVAARAGFAGVGLNHTDLLAARRESGDREIRALFADNGITYFEVEALTGWYSDGAERRESDQRRADFLDAAAQLGVDLIKVIGNFGAGSPQLDRVRRELATLAGQAADVGARIGIEPSPFLELSTPQMVLTMLDDIDHDAAGIILDNWQIDRGGIEFETLAGIPCHRIAGVDLSDAPQQPRRDPIDDCFNHRYPPGCGELDVTGFVQTVDATGYQGWWNVEILSRSYRDQPIAIAVPDAYHRAATHLEVVSQRAGE